MMLQKRIHVSLLRCHTLSERERKPNYQVPPAKGVWWAECFAGHHFRFDDQIQVPVGMLVERSTCPTPKNWLKLGDNLCLINIEQLWNSMGWFPWGLSTCMVDILLFFVSYCSPSWKCHSSDCSLPSRLFWGWCVDLRRLCSQYRRGAKCWQFPEVTVPQIIHF